MQAVYNEEHFEQPLLIIGFHSYNEATVGCAGKKCVSAWASPFISKDPLTVPRGFNAVFFAFCDRRRQLSIRKELARLSLQPLSRFQLARRLNLFRLQGRLICHVKPANQVEERSSSSRISPLVSN